MELAVAVTSAFPGFIDTDMMAGVETPKAQPRLVADRSLDGWQAERASVFPDRLAELVEHAVLCNMAAVLDDPHAVMTELVSALGSDAPRCRSWGPTSIPLPAPDAARRD